MRYDYSKLLGRIIEMFGTRAVFADKMCMSEHTLSRKLTTKEGSKHGISLGNSCNSNLLRDHRNPGKGCDRSDKEKEE